MHLRIALVMFAVLFGASQSYATFLAQSFVELCENPRIDRKVEETFQILLLSVGVKHRNPATCAWAEPRLKKLKEFDFGEEKIQDLSPFATLPNITALHVKRSNYLDIQTIAGLNTLESLTLHGVNIYDLSDLSLLFKLPSLKRLDLEISHSNIEPVSLSSLKDARFESLILKINKNLPIVDFEMLASVKELKELELIAEGSEIHSLSFLSSLNGLQRLVVKPSRSSEYHDLSPLLGMESLSSLELYNGRVESLENLGSLAALEELTLSRHAITSLHGIDQLQSLKTLDLSANMISTIAGIESLVKLQNLKLHENKIIKLDPLAQLHQLTTVGLDGNQISTIIFLSQLPALESLSINGNTLEILPDLSALTRLSNLNLKGNKISDVASLAGCVSLEVLDLQGNPIKSYSPLYPLTVPHENHAGNLIKLQIIR